MKISPILFAAALSFGVSNAAFAQTTVPSTGGGIQPGTTPTGTSNQVGTANDGSSISNNRDVLSPGTGTAPSQVDQTRKTDRKVMKSKGDKRKDKVKSSPM